MCETHKHVGTRISASLPDTQATAPLGPVPVLGKGTLPSLKPKSPSPAAAPITGAFEQMSLPAVPQSQPRAVPTPPVVEKVVQASTPKTVTAQRPATPARPQNTKIDDFVVKDAPRGASAADIEQFDRDQIRRLLSLACAEEARLRGLDAEATRQLFGRLVHILDGARPSGGSLTEPATAAGVKSGLQRHRQADPTIVIPKALEEVLTRGRL